MKRRTAGLQNSKSKINKVAGKNVLEHLGVILSSLNIGVLVVNSDGRVEFANQSFCKLYDLDESPEQLSGLSSADMISKVIKLSIDPEWTIARINKIVAEGKPVKNEEITVKGGRTYMRDFIPLVIDGKLCGRIWHHYDITNSKQMEEALRKSEERFRSLFENHSAIMLVIDPETGNIIGANKAAANFYGWPVERLQEMNIGQINTLSRDALEREISRARVTQDNLKYESCHRRADGSVRNVEVYSNWQKLSETSLLYFVIHDITSRKQAEMEKEKLEAQNRQLQKSESLSRMAGAIAHHFNNQLQAIMLNMEMAKSYLPRGTGSTEFLTDVMKSAHKAAEVSSLMLTYLGKTVVKREPMDLSDACQKHLPVLRNEIVKNMVLEVDLPLSGPVINGNCAQIHQILTNLVTNAVEAMNGTRGVIRLTVKTVLTTEIPTANRFPVNCELGDLAYACMEVSDFGCGILEKDIENLFDPFFSSKFVGRGMGLAVVLGILRAHDGIVTVESKPSQGSVFRVFLPMLDQAVPPKLPKAAEPARKGVLLLVEDEASVRHAFELVLKLFGFKVLSAKDGVEAMELFQEHRDKIECVICDLCMPRMNGWDTLLALRKLSPKLPVILTSGYSEADALAGCNRSDLQLPDAFLTKPFDLQKLFETVTQVLKKKQPSKPG